MNICIFSIKLPISVKICLAVIEILTFNKRSSKVYGFHKRTFLLTVHGVDGRRHRRNCRNGKTNTDRMMCRGWRFREGSIVGAKSARCNSGGPSTPVTSASCTDRCGDITPVGGLVLEGRLSPTIPAAPIVPQIS